MIVTIERLSRKFIKWKDAFENNCLKYNIGKTKVIVGGNITKMACLKDM